MKNKKTLNDYLLFKAKLECRLEKDIESYIELFTMHRYKGYDFSLDPISFLNSLIEGFPCGIESEDVGKSFEISTGISLLAELKVDSSDVEDQLIWFTKNSIIPWAFDQQQDHIIDMLEGIAWSLAEIGTRKSLHLIEMIISSPLIEKTGAYPHIVSACLYAFKQISERDILEFYLAHYPKIKDNHAHSKEAYMEKIDYYDRHPSKPAFTQNVFEYYKYLLRMKEILETNK